MNHVQSRSCVQRNRMPARPFGLLGSLCALAVILLLAFAPNVWASAFAVDAQGKFGSSEEELQRLEELLDGSIELDSSGRAYVRSDDIIYYLDVLEKSGFGGSQWTDGILPFEFKSVDGRYRKLFYEHKKAWEDVSAVQIVEDPSAKNRVRVVMETDPNACGSSSIGMVSGVQQLAIGSKCWTHRTIAHELGHALGLNHEQSRSDRDDYVEVFTENICNGYSHNFRKADTVNEGDYDFESIMHYSRTALGKPLEDGVCKQQKVTIQKKSDPDAPLGGSTLTDLDKEGMKNHYGPRLKRTLKVNSDPDGLGEVISYPAGIICHKTYDFACEHAFPVGKKVTLAATVFRPEDRFAGWSGDCKDEKTDICVVTLDKAREATPRFTKNPNQRFAKLRLDRDATEVSILKGSGQSVGFFWETNGLAGYSQCNIHRLSNGEIRGLLSFADSRISGGSHISESIHDLEEGLHRFRLRCTGPGKPIISSPYIEVRIIESFAGMTYTIDDQYLYLPHKGKQRVTFRWSTKNLDNYNYTCELRRKAGDSLIYKIPNNKRKNGTYTHQSMQNWSTGNHVINLVCKNNKDGNFVRSVTVSVGPKPTALLRFNSVTGSKTEEISRNSGAKVKFAWKMENVGDHQCKIWRTSDVPGTEQAVYTIPAKSWKTGTYESSTIHTWSRPEYQFFVRCQKAMVEPVQSEAIKLTINEKVQLKVVKAGNGTGRVHSLPLPAVIDCGSKCSAKFALGNEVSLTAVPDSDAIVVESWINCGRTDSGCKVTMDRAKQVTVNFQKVKFLQNGVAETGVGAAKGKNLYRAIRVPAGARNLAFTTSGGSGKLAIYARHGEVPWGTSRFDCKSEKSGTSQTCTIATPGEGVYYLWLRATEKYSNVKVTASYSVGEVMLMVFAGDNTASGGGRVTIAPLGVDCRSVCEIPIPLGTTIKLSAIPDPGWRLTRFVVTYGGTADTCPGQSTCTINVDRASIFQFMASALFVRIQ